MEEHPDREGWVRYDPDMLVRATRTHEFVSSEPKPQKSGHRLVEYVSSAKLPDGKEDFVKLVTSLPKTAGEAEIVTTAIPQGHKDIFLKGGKLRAKYREAGD